MHIHRKAKQSKEKLLTNKVVAHHSLFVVSVFPMVLHTSPLQKSFFLQFVPLTYRRKSNVQGGNLELPREKAEIIYLDTILGFPRKTEVFSHSIHTRFEALVTMSKGLLISSIVRSICFKCLNTSTGK